MKRYILNVEFLRDNLQLPYLYNTEFCWVEIFGPASTACSPHKEKSFQMERIDKENHLVIEEGMFETIKRCAGSSKMSRLTGARLYTIRNHLPSSKTSLY